MAISTCSTTEWDEVFSPPTSKVLMTLTEILFVISLCEQSLTSFLFQGKNFVQLPNNQQDKVRFAPARQV